MNHSDQGTQYGSDAGDDSADPSPGTEHEPEGELLGQCRCRIVFQQLEEGADQEADLQGPTAGVSRRGRLQRYSLQSDTPPQSTGRRSEKVSTKSWELHSSRK